MGRYYTGAITTRESLRLELKYLKENQLIQKGKEICTLLNWTGGANIFYRSVYTEEEMYIELRYTINSKKPNQENLHYKIYLEELPSNLGKGALLYMVCPVSGLYSRKLYMAYGSTMFKNRRAYTNRIYYPSQVASKTNRYNTKYWELKERLHELSKKRDQKYYKGVLTSRAKYINKQYEILEELEVKRWEELSDKLKALVGMYGII